MALTKVTGQGLETLSDGVTITVDDNSDTLTLTSTAADANIGPNMRFYRNSSSPADDDLVGGIVFDSRNDNSQDIQLVRIRAYTPDVSDGTEDGAFDIATMTNGALSNRMDFLPTETIFNNSSIDVDFRVESNGNTHAFFLNGGDGLISFGNATTSLTTGTSFVAGDNYALYSGVNATTAKNHCVFGNGNGYIGSITTSGSATAYNTSSDYRLKENVDYSWDATTRLKQLKPARFNFISDDTNTLVDGFLAHEVSSIVPAAISGEKDAVDSDGKPEHQGIDHSKLVPLLVKTIQELEARITALE